MIRAVMYWNKLRLEVEGHAGTAEKGKDLVCAAASMMTGALAGALEEAMARGRTIGEWKQEDGNAVIWADPNMGSLNEIKAYFRMCVKGFRMLQEEYPANVSIKEVL